MNGQESVITIQMVHGGFILHTDDATSGLSTMSSPKTEVFTSQGKLMKAIRAAIDAGSLVKKEKEEDAPTA